MQKELERVKRSRGEYASARVAVVQKELEKKNQQLHDEAEKKHAGGACRVQRRQKRRHS